MDLPPRVRPALPPPPHAPSPARPRRYWGALTNSSRLTGNLEAWFVDLDGDRIGAGMTRAVQNFVPHGPALNWTFKDPADTGDNDAIASAVLREQVWVAIVGESSFPASRDAFPALYATPRAIFMCGRPFGRLFPRPHPNRAVPAFFSLCCFPS